MSITIRNKDLLHVMPRHSCISLTTVLQHCHDIISSDKWLDELFSAHLYKGDGFVSIMRKTSRVECDFVDIIDDAKELIAQLESAQCVAMGVMKIKTPARRRVLVIAYSPLMQRHFVKYDDDME